ncbi:MAG: hypothetical protein JNK58_11330, partial [Phycisphaerae bacterium]|nr:hypothetical protein [Phycisphaerae bacterium]
PNSAEALGGGTIGVIPFRLHRTDCDPAHESVIEWDNATNKVCMRHYGPVTWDPEDGEPYKVERRKAGSSDSWQEQDCFTSTIDEDNDTIVWVKTTEAERFHRGFEYRVSLRTRTSDSEHILRCNLTIPGGGTPQVANFDPLTFTICDADPAHSPGDADDNGCVNFSDITCVLANWQSTDCMKLGDADRDGDVDFADITTVNTYLSNAYCGSCSSSLAASQSRRGGVLGMMDLVDEDAGAGAESLTVGEALGAMGYASIEAFVAAISVMDEETRNATIQQFGQLIGGEQ